MYRLNWTDTAKKAYTRLEQEAGRKSASRQAGLLKQVRKALKFLRENPRHRSLQTHPYNAFEHPWSTSEKVFEAYVQNRTPGADRIFWCYGPNSGEITVLTITPHP